MRGKTVTGAVGALLASLALGGALAAQNPAATPQPRTEDVATLDGIMNAVYDVISGPRGQARDWDRMRSLFLPGARLIPTGRRPDGVFVSRLLSVEDYITGSGAQIEQIGFREREVARRVEQFGNIAQVFSTYEGFREGDEQPFLRGLNSFQLFNDGTRWWVVNILWEAETPDNPVPAKYMTSPPDSGS